MSAAPASAQIKPGDSLDVLGAGVVRQDPNFAYPVFGHPTVQCGDQSASDAASPMTLKHANFVQHQLSWVRRLDESHEKPTELAPWVMPVRRLALSQV